MTSTSAAPVRRGRRVALPPAAPLQPHGGQVYLVTGRELRFEGRLVPAGVEVPGAAGWRRVDVWVNARRIRPVAPGEEYTTYEEWVAPLLKAEAKEAKRLAALAQAKEKPEAQGEEGAEGSSASSASSAEQEQQTRGD